MWSQRPVRAPLREEAVAAAVLAVAVLTPVVAAFLRMEAPPQEEVAVALLAAVLPRGSLQLWGAWMVACFFSGR